MPDKIFPKLKIPEIFVINRKLTELIGFSNPQEAIGERIDYMGNEFKIVGVVEDFHAQSLQKSIENVIFGNFNGLINELAIKINPTIINSDGYQELIKKLQTEWDGVFPKDIMNFQLFDEKNCFLV